MSPFLDLARASEWGRRHDLINAAVFYVVDQSRYDQLVWRSGFVTQPLNVLSYRLDGVGDGHCGYFVSGAPQLLGIRTGEISTQPLTVLPLNLFPNFIVPFFILVHLSTLIQVVKGVGSSFKSPAVLVGS